MADGGKTRDGAKTRASYPELVPGVAFLVAAAILLFYGLSRSASAPALKPLLFQLAAATCIAASGFLSAALTAMAVQRGPQRRSARASIPGRPWPGPLEVVRRRAFGFLESARGIDWLGSWLPVTVGVLLALLAIFALVKGWRAGGTVLPDARIPWAIGGMIALCFPMLVLERRFASLKPAATRDARSLTYLLRLVLFTLIGLSLAQALCRFALPFPTAVEHVVLVFDGLVALELALRGLSYIFLPLPPPTERSHAASLFASLLRLQRPSLKALQSSMNSQFGIDLGRSWALGYIRRALFPMAAGLAICGWLLTGVSTLGDDERAVYEVYGTPHTVFHPGLHVYLPWPFGRLKPVEYGVVHQIPIAFLDEEIYGKPMAEKKKPEEKPTINGPQPVSADRLWEASRPTEASYLVAANQNGRENFEVINIDLRIAYRIGMDDRSAMDAVYRLASPEDLIRAAAGRMLARYFARYTLPAILGQDRETFIRNFQKELQARLNTISGSIDILSVVIETIHPPAGVAEAYQQVQASAIDAVTKVANARGDAVRDVGQAQADATEARDTAAARAAETVAEAKVGTALFGGDVAAYRAGGPAFLFEKRLGILSTAITAETPVTILDSRIPASQQQMLQMRPQPAATPGQ
jgi:regulator of protease activity HflC (stomatin/prohibitin superfamily)